ncbi:MAG TPA: aminotransferase class I/II-fold pyridoxal phosphate-dependent enzyme, partial [Spirochaetia bacterium]
PLYHASTYAQTSVDSFGAWDYARSGNPTRQAVEKTIAELEGGAAGFAFASGMAAISSTLLLFRPGDHIVVGEDVYGGAFRVMTRIFEPWGARFDFVDATDVDAVRAALRPETRALYVETPSNPLLKIADLRALSTLARERGILTIVDNTFMTPWLQRPLELGCDIVLHSGTKFLNGHTDVVCGFAVAAGAAMGESLRFVQNAFGAVLGPSDAWLALRGMRTLGVRMEESQRSAMTIARWLEGHAHVTRLRYPGLASHPGHDVHLGQAAGPGAVLSFELDTVERTRRLLEGVRLSAFAVSLGGVESVLSWPARMSHAAMPAEERARRGISDTLVRLSVGLEDPDDLIAEMDSLIG